MGREIEKVENLFKHDQSVMDIANKTGALKASPSKIRSRHLLNTSEVQKLEAPRMASGLIGGDQKDPSRSLLLPPFLTNSAKSGVFHKRHQSSALP